LRRKAYEYVEGLDQPEPLFLNEKEISPTPMLNTNGAWGFHLDPVLIEPVHGFTF
jgi:glyoxylate utilization-related uncharacterized protein